MLRAEPELLEAAILMRALRDSNTAKIVQEDEPIFYGLLGDLFPGLDPPRKIDPNLQAALIESCEKLQLWPDTDYIDRCMQLAELLTIRHCVFLLGPPGCGRTEVIKGLAGANGVQGQKTRIEYLNPKALSPKGMFQLYFLSLKCFFFYCSHLFSLVLTCSLVVLLLFHSCFVPLLFCSTLVPLLLHSCSTLAPLLFRIVRLHYRSHAGMERRHAE